MTNASTSGPGPLHGAVASPHYLATEAGQQALADGGTAVDAALATAAVLAVVAPHQCGIGGDAVGLIGAEDGGVTVFQGAGRAPAGVDVDAVREAGRGRMPLYGPHAVTVPGALSTWAAMHDAAGRLPWHRLLAPAHQLASEGFTLGPSLGRSLEGNVDRVSADPGLRAFLLRDDAPITVGDTVRHPALARTLATLTNEGPGALYGGQVGEQVVATLRRHGSAMSLDDLTGHRCDVATAISAPWGGTTVWTAPPPSQGLVLLQVLGLLTAMGGRRDWLGADAGLLAGAISQTSADRDRRLADPVLAPVDVDAWLAPDRLATLARAVLDGSTPDAPGAPKPGGDTVGIVAADDEGRFVSLIFSLFYSFGSGICDPATGLVLHNRGAGFSVADGSPNRLNGGKRPAHTLMPVLLSTEKGWVAAHGTMGGYAQPQIHTQLLLQRDRGADPQQMVTAPRWILERPEDADGAELLLVEESVPQVAQQALRSTGIRVRGIPDRSDDVGHAHAVRSTGTGGLEAGTDPRADGPRPDPAG